VNAWDFDTVNIVDLKIIFVGGW